MLIIYILLIYSVNVGSISLPALLNIKQVMAQRQVAGMWNAKDELPVMHGKNELLLLCLINKHILI